MIDSSAVEINIFKVNNQILISRQPGGIFQFDQLKMRKLAGSELFTNKSVLGILPFKKDFLIKTNEKGFHILKQKGNVLPFVTDVDSFIKQNTFTCAIPVADGFYAIGTMRGGFVVIDKNGNYITGLNEKNGLYNDYVHDMFLDRRNNLWLSLNNGICRTEVPSAFTYFNRNTGVHGGISSICRFKGKVYIATSQGVYYLKTHVDDNFDKTNFASEKFISVNNLNADGGYNPFQMCGPFRNLTFNNCSVSHNEEFVFAGTNDPSGTGPNFLDGDGTNNSGGDIDNITVDGLISKYMAIQTLSFAPDGGNTIKNISIKKARQTACTTSAFLFLTQATDAYISTNL